LFRRGETVRTAFSKKPEGVRGQKIEVVTPTHPLVRFVARLREDAGGGPGARPAVWGQLNANSISTEVAPGDYGLVVQRWSVDGVTPQDKLVYSGVNLATGDAITDEQSEAIVSSAMMSLQPARPDAGRARQAAEVIETILISGRMMRAQQDFVDFEEAVHEDKRATLLAVLHHQLDSHRSKVEARINEYLAAGGTRARIVPAERGKLEKYMARMKQKILAAEKASGFEFNEPTTFGILVAEVR
jgi:hypothetical protein